jgi:hypothetical protein
VRIGQRILVKMGGCSGKKTADAPVAKKTPKSTGGKSLLGEGVADAKKISDYANQLATADPVDVNKVIGGLSADSRSKLLEVLNGMMKTLPEYAASVSTMDPADLNAALASLSQESREKLANGISRVETTQEAGRFQFVDEAGDVITLTLAGIQVKVNVARLGDVGECEGFVEESRKYCAEGASGIVPEESVPGLKAFLDQAGRFQFVDGTGDVITLTLAGSKIMVNVARLGDVGEWESFDEESGTYRAGGGPGGVPAASIPGLKEFLEAANNKVLREGGDVATDGVLVETETAGVDTSKAGWFGSWKCCAS